MVLSVKFVEIREQKFESCLLYKITFLHVSRVTAHSVVMSGILTSITIDILRRVTYFEQTKESIGNY